MKYELQILMYFRSVFIIFGYVYTIYNNENAYKEKSS